MNEQLKKVLAFHTKYKVKISDQPAPLDADTAALRHRIMREEVDEYLPEATGANIEYLAKELADVIYTVYGTVIAHGLHEKFDDVFAEVHRSNMTKEYDPIKPKKGATYTPADIATIFTDYTR